MCREYFELLHSDFRSPPLIIVMTSRARAMNVLGEGEREAFKNKKYTRPQDQRGDVIEKHDVKSFQTSSSV